ncbi:hypothetical protein D3C72_1432670 [compost metagenome]
MPVATASRGLHGHSEQVQPQGEMADHLLHVLVVTRVGVQLGRPRQHMADVPALALPYRQRHQAEAQRSHQHCVAWLGNAPEAVISPSRRARRRSTLAT